MNDTSTATGETGNAEPSTLTARSLSASLTVSDIQKSLAWYRDIIGFAIDREHVREGRLMAVALKAGEVRILITQDDGTRGTDRINRVGAA